MEMAVGLARRCRLLRRLIRERAGIVAAEFALLAPVVLLMFTGTYAVIMVHLGSVALEGGTAAAARAAITGVLPAAGTREDGIRAVITRHVCPRSLGLGTVCYWDSAVMDDTGNLTDPLTIETLAYVDPRNIGRPEPFADVNGNGAYDDGETYSDVNENGRWDADMGRASAGGSGDHVLYDVRMAQPVRHPLLVPLFGSVIVHHTQMVIRNEPY